MACQDDGDALSGSSPTSATNSPEWSRRHDPKLRWRPLKNSKEYCSAFGMMPMLLLNDILDYLVSEAGK